MNTRKILFGPIPSIPVGTRWRTREQIFKSGVHRARTAGIHGRKSEGAFSIVLSYEYIHDRDYGEYFFYSGCGQGSQKLVRGNRALAVSCQVRPVDDKIGANAKEKWREGKPVRVIRKHCNTSKYAPRIGYRYEGIYKVQRYYQDPATGSNRVWVFVMRRVDESPPPWIPQQITK